MNRMKRAQACASVYSFCTDRFSIGPLKSIDTVDFLIQVNENALCQIEIK